MIFPGVDGDFDRANEKGDKGGSLGSDLTEDEDDNPEDEPEREKKQEDDVAAEVFGDQVELAEEEEDRVDEVAEPRPSSEAVGDDDGADDEPAREKQTH